MNTGATLDVNTFFAYLRDELVRRWKASRPDVPFDEWLKSDAWQPGPTATFAAPGPPPRPGLQWKESTHRWINPQTKEEHSHQPQDHLHIKEIGHTFGPGERIPPWMFEGAPPKIAAAMLEFNKAQPLNPSKDSKTHDAALRQARSRLARFTVGVGVTDKQLSYCTAKAHEVLARMPVAALDRFSKDTHGVTLHESEESLTAYFKKHYRQSVRPGHVILGIHTIGGNLHLTSSPGRRETEETFAHEFFHAVDMAGGTGGYGSELSESPGWQAAWKAEMKGTRLSELAGTAPHEGFAEFGRLLYGAAKVNTAAIKKKYPLSYAFFSARGLVS